jgi:hypothetical protein
MELGPQGDQRLAPDGSEHEAIPGRADLGTDYTDNVERAHAFVRRHPHVSILWPRTSGTGQFLAVWTEASADPAEDGVTQRAGHERLGFLMGYLEARFDRAAR